jgi:hypothetical protein
MTNLRLKMAFKHEIMVKLYPTKKGEIWKE